MTAHFDLSGRVILVTGSGRGLGWAMAEALAEAGALVVLNGRDAAKLAERVAALQERGLKAAAAAFDVADLDQVPAHLAGLAERHGRLDGLINNAGIQHRAPLVEWQTADFERLLRTNLTACFVIAREAAKIMLAQGGGRIVNIASVMGPQARPTIPGYTTAKGGITALTRALAVELGGKGVLVNAIAPGFFETDMNAALTTNPQFAAMVSTRTPMGRWAQPEEIGGAAVFLMSPAASYVNGHVLFVDGGLSVAV